ncbi:MAG: tRNA preQ1(34) S-adenosylmethionine ribosyltransferase-isomerase QueA [Anaerolineae bacterium]|nr:tRNA preQ1(34) S-adenosylmethionine ribosyltransferase-isomerase QueA [Anaerolineae bacterium]
MKTRDFDYELPPELIAQRPLPQRDASRLLVLHRADGRIEHRQFTDIQDYLRPGDVLVVNNSRVIPARLYGRKTSGGQVEILLLSPLDNTRWQALVGGKRLHEGTEIHITGHDGKETTFTATVTAVLAGPRREIQFSQPIQDYLDELGHTPLPPYIHEPLADVERYQTIFAHPPGSAAAPTAGLHFTSDLLLAMRNLGIILETVTLHVGLDTFQPVAAEYVVDHTIHSEWTSLTPETARRINEAKLAGGRIMAVGTTAVRTLETAACRSAGITGSLQTISQRDAGRGAAGETSNLCPWRPVMAFEGATDLFIYPGYRFRAVDMMITNFHLPQSSLLMLVSAFAGQGLVRQAYATAVAERYRFFSFGDAMCIV